MGMQRAFLAFLLGVLVYDSLSEALVVQGVQVHTVPLRRSEETSPYCYAASSTADLHEHNPPINFLATQVWPSARLASSALQQHLETKWTVCEFGCGPGLPSLTAAKLGSKRVIASDLDPFALALVRAAATAQGMTNVETVQVDLMEVDTPFPRADLYILSDVFESSAVASGAARITSKILSSGARVWVFAQSDRSQRECFLKELQFLCDVELKWQPMNEYDSNVPLWLCNVEESTVPYG